MKLTCTCPIDGHSCQTPFFRAIGKKGALAAKHTVPHSMRVAYGQRPPAEGKRPRGRPRIENERKANA